MRTPTLAAVLATGISATVVAYPTGLRGQDRDYLTGLDTVAVSVFMPNDEAMGGRIKTQVESALRRNGIAVVSEGQGEKARVRVVGGPVNTQRSFGRETTLVYFWNVALQQAVCVPLGGSREWRGVYCEPGLNVYWGEILPTPVGYSRPDNLLRAVGEEADRISNAILSAR